MADILTPALGESVTEATVGKWSKQAGDMVKRDEVLAELETDKVSLEVSAPDDGVLQIDVAEGETVTAGQKLGSVGDARAQPAAAPTTPKGGSAKAKTPPSTATSAAPDGEAQPEAQAGQPQPQPTGQVPDTSAPAPGAAPAPALAPQGGGADVTVPTMGESVTEGTIGKWTKQAGDAVKRDEVLVEIETDKVALEVASPADGVLGEILAKEGETVKPGQVLARVGGASSSAPSPAQGKTQPSAPGEDTPANEPPAAQKGDTPASMPLAPSVQRIVTEQKLDPAQIAGTGRDGRITKGDALAASAAPPSSQETAPKPQPAPVLQVAAAPPTQPRAPAEREERVRMTRLRQTIARRLKDAQNTAAMLTTFNEVDMTAVMALRNQYKDVFEKRHGVKLGFMSFFVKACIAALKDVPAVNAEIDGQDLIYKNHYDIGIAVGTEKGLVVPVVRDADAISLAGVEKAIGDLGRKARDGKLAIEDMQGGTFSITNGGIYGSLMSTPILNAPQSGILGMHAIKERPMVVGGKIEVRPMMYLALSYDHRVVDGKEAVTFLVAVKDHVEDPQRLILDL